MKIGESNCPCDKCGVMLNSRNFKSRCGKVRKYLFGMFQYYYWDGGICYDCSHSTGSRNYKQNEESVIDKDEAIDSSYTRKVTK